MCRVGFEQNKILRWQLRECSGNVVNRSVCRFRHGVDAARHYAAIGDEFSIIRYEEAMTVSAEMSGFIKYRHDNNGIEHLLREFGEIRRRIWRGGGRSRDGRGCSWRRRGPVGASGGRFATAGHAPPQEKENSQTAEARVHGITSSAAVQLRKQENCVRIDRSDVNNWISRSAPRAFAAGTHLEPEHRTELNRQKGARRRP